VSHWERWHEAYEDPASALSVRLRLVQDDLRGALEARADSPVRLLSLCAGQGRDVIDVLADAQAVQTRPTVQAAVQAVLIELDPELVDFARRRAAASGLEERVVRVVEGDASDPTRYADAVPADIVLVCGLFGNISDDDVAHVVRTLPSFCAAGADVLWTRHRRPPDLTPSIRRWFGEAGFEEVRFDAPPSPFVMTVGWHRLVGPPAPFDAGRLFDFVGDGGLPA
jgi:hypothetical protein